MCVGGGYTDTVKEREGKEIDRDRQRAIGWREGQEEKERGGGVTQRERDED